MTGRLLWILLAAAPAAAADHVQLPPGERAADWRTALELAELELGGDAPADGARIRIEVISGGDWVLTAEGPEGVRTARIEAPTTAAAREDLAFLARGLARSVSVAAPTAPAVTAPPLPPPPAPAPAPAEPAPAPPPPEPEPVITLVVRQPEPEAPTQAVVIFDPAPAAGARRRRPERRPLEVPPLRLSTGFAVRGGLEPAFTTAVGMDLARVGRAALGWDLDLAFARDVRLELMRRMSAADAAFSIRAPLGGRLELGGTAGASWRTFRQQFTPVQAAPMAFVGLRGSIVVASGRKLGLLLDLAPVLDLGTTTLFREDGRSVSMSPFELRVGIRGRFHGGGDPNRAEPTSN